MNKKQCLIIFVRYPELGQVKTRIGNQIGNGKTLAIYNELLSHTFGIVAHLQCKKYIFAIGPPDIPLNLDFEHQVMQQKGNDIGERMQNSFNQMFREGFSKIVLIGSDIYELTTAIITDAFHKLDEVECTIGPANDGGYYLLGLAREIPSIFDDIMWSSEHTLDQTIRQINLKGLTYQLLPKLNDVDTLEDIYRYEKLKTILNEA
jgi:uncharacterized protein